MKRNLTIWLSDVLFNLGMWLVNLSSRVNRMNYVDEHEEGV